MTVRILNCDVIEGLRQLEDESVHCVVTSPPYWGLRDYGMPGQLGLESTFATYVTAMAEVFDEVRRVLRSDGTLWLNLGDCYAGSWGAQSRSDAHDSPVSADQISAHPKTTQTGSKNRFPGLKPKDLVGIPWRVAFALQARGWWLRSDIVWSKPNPMPESVTDRPTKSHEYVFLLTKSERYFYDAEAIKEAAAYPNGPNSPASIASPYGQGFTRRAPAISDERKDLRSDVESRHRASIAGGQSMQAEPDGKRNKRSVWNIATAPFAEAHFATFPPELPGICIKAGCPKGGTVLDPFGGAGTTGLVADRLQRNAVLIELNPEYAAMARRRIDGDRGLLLDAMEAAQ
jgi:DNA modification methylase